MPNGGGWDTASGQPQPMVDPYERAAQLAQSVALEQRVAALEKELADHQHRIFDKLKRWTAPAKLECRHHWELTDTSILTNDRRTVRCAVCEEIGLADIVVRTSANGSALSADVGYSSLGDSKERGDASE